MWVTIIAASCIYYCTKYVVYSFLVFLFIYFLLLSKAPTTVIIHLYRELALCCHKIQIDHFSPPLNCSSWGVVSSSVLRNVNGFVCFQDKEIEWIHYKQQIFICISTNHLCDRWRLNQFVEFILFFIYLFIDMFLLGFFEPFY